MLNFRTTLAAIAAMAASSVCYPQAEIVDSKPIVRHSPGVVSTPSPSAARAAENSELYFQLQMLQEEVQLLRGLVEEQAHEIRNLKQRQLEDYVDLDRRLSELNKAKPAASIPVPSSPTTRATARPDTDSTQAPAIGAASSEDELTIYDKAVRLIIKDKELDQGSRAMQAYIDQFPNGIYVSNAQYWVGQVAYIQGDLQTAQTWFSELLRVNPASQKAPEAKYKLATVLHKLGDNAEAKTLLMDVAATSSSAARLAQEYLRNNFN